MNLRDLASIARWFAPLHRALLPLRRLRDPEIVPERFKREAARLRTHRYRSVTVPSARRLFALAALKYGMLRGDGERRRGPRRWRKLDCDTYIRACLRVALPLADKVILFQAAGEAFGEQTRTILRAWEGRDDRPRRRRKLR